MYSTGANSRKRSLQQTPSPSKCVAAALFTVHVCTCVKCISWTTQTSEALDYE